ncbi:MAG: hypothetical protein RL458_1692 [Pseudomonadota bacterium]|jgi:hypothetical protein
MGRDDAQASGSPPVALERKREKGPRLCRQTSILNREVQVGHSRHRIRFIRRGTITTAVRESPWPESHYWFKECMA